MSETVTIASIAEQIRAGQLRRAKRGMANLLDSADTQTLATLQRCASILAKHPDVAVPELRALWLRAPQWARDIIQACAPRRGEAVCQPEQQDQRPAPYSRETLYRAPRDDRREVRPELKTGRKQRTEEPAEVGQYARERAGVDDAPERGERPDGYSIDYDKAAVHPLRSLGCVACTLERSRADEQHRDGLCSDCREGGIDGIRPLPAGATRAQVVTARCERITRHLTGEARLARLRGYYRKVSSVDKATISAYAGSHEPEQAPTAAAQQNPEGPAACDGCGEARRLRDTRHGDDGLCQQCRHPETAETFGRTPSVDQPDTDDQPAAA
jgi:hypothetical protein